MALPQNTSKIIEFLRPGIIQSEYSVTDRKGLITIQEYNGSGVVPTEQELLDAEAGSTLVNGQTFTQWHDENGGNPTLTYRKKVKDRVDETSKIGVELRAIIQLFNKRDNYLTNRIIELQDRVQAMLDSVGGADAMRTAGLNIPLSPISTRSLSDAKQDYKDGIDLRIAD